jgi:hypothetical protein
MKNIAEISTFLEDVLGKDATRIFEENFDEFMYYVRSEALNNREITDKAMRIRLKNLAEGIIAASVKKFLNDNYADSMGGVEINVNDNGVYDRDMHPIPAIDKIRKNQKGITALMVSRGMYEFAKGRVLLNQSGKPEASQSQPKTAHRDTTPTVEAVEIDVMRLEGRLPNISKEEGELLASLYDKLAAMRMNHAASN